MITNKDFTTMKTEVGEFVGDTTSSFLSKVGKFLNFRYRDILRRYPWKQLYSSTTITTTANLATYALPWDFGELVYLYDNTNKKTLYQQPEAGEQNDTSLTASSDYFAVKESSVQKQPTSASVITLVSSSASDTSTSVYIKGTNSSGHVISETVTVNGTTDVTSSNSYTTVTQISKSSTSVGNFTLTTNSAAVTLAVIGPKQLHARYRILHLFYIPSTTGTSLVLRYKRQILPLVDDYDYPIIDVADEMIFGAQADAWRAKRQFAKAASLEQQYDGLIGNRIYQEEQNADNVFNPTPYDRDA